MATKIQEPGTNTYKGFCGECGAIFTYEREDIRTIGLNLRQVQCPHCQHMLQHTGKNGASG